MWENSGYDNAGGFYNESQGGETKTPGGTDRKRANNIVPVMIRDILDSGKFTILYFRQFTYLEFFLLKAKMV